MSDVEFLTKESAGKIPNSHVRIFIRSPAITLPEDFSILTKAQSSVLLLKKIISVNHPLKPKIPEQKLIYRGRVLKDSELIVEILKDDLSTDQTFHLVVKPSFDLETAKGVSSTVAQAIRSSYPWLRRRNYGNQLPDSNNNPSSSASNKQAAKNQIPGESQSSLGHEAPHISGYPSTTFQTVQIPPPQFQQELLFQQMQQQYARGTQQAIHSSQPNSLPAQQQSQPQYSSFAEQQVQQTSIPWRYPLYYCVMINGLPYMMPVQYIQYPFSYQPPLQNNVNLNPPQQVVQAQPVFVPPQPDQNNDAGGRNRRRAATFWLVLKLGFLVYLFSQNASVERIILLHIFALVVFLYQTGRLRIVRRRRHRAAAAHAFNNNVFAPPQIPPAIPHDQGVAPSIGQQNAASGSSHSPSSSSQLNQASSSSQNNERASEENVSRNHDNSTSIPSLHNDPTAGTSNEAPANPAIDQPLTWRDIEHGLWTFVASLIPTNAPDVGQQEENLGM
ncbi:hypothetical protein G9A89_023823 [Geosiphon pyriformis]|nr:hypothetical protein G9A89_023823 [Geosiphon pyriformis]